MAILAVLSGLAAAGISADFPRTAAAQEQPMQDLDRLKTLPLIEVIRSGTGQHVSRLTYSPDEPDSRLGGKTPLAAIEDLDAEMRCLTWLMFFAQGWILPDARDWLHTFFFMKSGDFAPQVRDALAQAGLSAQHQVFSEAMTSFGPSYPLAYDKRKTYFAWSTSADRPLTPLDRKLLALSPTFGMKSDYEGAVEGYVRGNAKLLQWAQETRPRVHERERLAWLMLRLYLLADGPERKLAQLPRPHQQLVRLGIFWGEVYNGGIEQFFLNSSGDMAPAVVQTLSDVGLTKEAHTVTQGIDLFPAPYPVDRQRRNRLMTGRTGRAIDKKLQGLGDQVDAPTIHRAMLDLAKREGLLPQ